MTDATETDDPVWAADGFPYRPRGEALNVLSNGTTPFEPQSIVECGVGPHWSSWSRPWWGVARCLLIEPDPRLINGLRAELAGVEGVTLLHQAIGDAGRARLIIERDGWSHMEHVVSPSEVCGTHHDEPWSVEVDVVPFCEVDPGDLDVVMLDMEGDERKVLETMVSRPKLLSVEMEGDRLARLGLPGGLCGYRNPHYEWIMAWMEEHDFRLAYLYNNDYAWTPAEFEGKYDWRSFLLQAEKLAIEHDPNRDLPEGDEE